MTQFAFDPARAADAMGRFAEAADGPVRLPGVDFAQGCMGALYNAERLAAAAGVVPTVTIDGSAALGDRVTGTVIGAAREYIDKAPAEVRTLYLATSAAVRQAHAAAKKATDQAQKLEGGASLCGILDAGELGAIPVVAVVIVVVAVAAIVATAWYFEQKAEIEQQGANLRAIELMNRTCALAEAQLRTTGKIQPDLVKMIGGLANVADSEAQKSTGVPSWMWWAGGGALALGVGYFGVRSWTKRLALWGGR